MTNYKRLVLIQG